MLASVAASVGLFGYLGVPATLVITFSHCFLCKTSLGTNLRLFVDGSFNFC